MKELAGFRAIIQGRVQGVFFRYFTRRHAQKLGLCGYVRNLPSGYEVEVVAEGEKEALNKLLEHLKQGPPGAKVSNVEIHWTEYSGRFNNFTVRY